jgi:glutamine cyclotransferase
MKKLYILIACVVVLASCTPKKKEPQHTNPPQKPVPAIEYELVATYPHDTNSFTEGFLFNDGVLFESTGAMRELPQTRSLFGSVDLKTGKISVKAELDKQIYFGEGITFLNGKVYQLTYKSKKGFVYNAKTFAQIGEFSFPSAEGWGFTNDGTNLIMSDGTDILTWIEPETYKVVKRIAITENGKSCTFLNELEWIDGYIFANVWTTNTIVKINPEDGKVLGKIDLKDLAYNAAGTYPGSLEMNGIAYNPDSKTLFVTGKMWPTIYEIRLVE